jgi:hypothetical protein
LARCLLVVGASPAPLLLLPCRARGTRAYSQSSAPFFHS